MGQCNCRVCERHREFAQHLASLYEAGLDDAAKFFNDLMQELAHVETDSSMFKCIIDGSWPSADEQIYFARKEKSNHVCGLMGFNPMLGDSCPACEERYGR
jgi:hypothetical protein